MKENVQESPSEDRAASAPANTPGPWLTSGPGKKVPGFSDGGDYCIYVETPNGRRIIADVIRQVEHDEYAPVEANARLIAAAPDLLGACFDAMYELYDLAHSSGDPDDAENTDNLAVTYRHIKATINKATKG